MDFCRGRRKIFASMRIRAVIFDFDGVIADTEGLHFESFARVLAEEGIVITREENDRRFLGINDRAGFEKALEEAGRSLPPGSAEALKERKSVFYRERLAEARLFPGVDALLAGLAARVPLAVASGGRGVEIDAVLRANHVRPFFACIVSADEVLRSKPAPDSFLRALDLLRDLPPVGGRLEPAECLVVEDAPPGVQAARAAGMPCLAVAHSFTPEALAGAERIVRRIGDLTAEEVLGITQAGLGRTAR
jgi:beta-phosphoglucomutase